mmetsp:Transcript_33243/g.54909  ORF Transcript_33243/g.54909 Transcript_33243/m.54909 type:complete len:187 (+) Transcript_33243:1-561(+)
MRRTRSRERDALGPWQHAVATIARSWCDTEALQLPCQIMPWLLLSDAHTAGEAEVLREHGVTHVLNAAGPSEGRMLVAKGIGAKYKQLGAQDRADYPILVLHWREAWDFLEEARQQGGRVLMHCQAGINRSGCLAAAALMMHERIPVVDAVQRCKAARGTVLLNTGFQQALVRLAESENLLGPKPM